MKILAINGSPRAMGNTATLLQHVLDGAAGEGLEIEMINLYGLDFKGCTSCFYCKRKDMEHGVCAMKDDLTGVLEKIKQADALVFGSPIYYMTITSGLSALFERLFFSNMIYNPEIPTVFPKVMPAGLIYDMNITEEQAGTFHIKSNLEMHQQTMATIFRHRPHILYSYNTYQFSDYSRYESSALNEPAKRKQREEIFPLDCYSAFEMGRDLAQEAKELSKNF